MNAQCIVQDLYFLKRLKRQVHRNATSPASLSSHKTTVYILINPLRAWILRLPIVSLFILEWEKNWGLYNIQRDPIRLSCIFYTMSKTSNSRSNLQIFRSIYVYFNIYLQIYLNIFFHAHQNILRFLYSFIVRFLLSVVLKIVRAYLWHFMFSLLLNPLPQMSQLCRPENKTYLYNLYTSV
jgi:hypothetical protein